MHYIGGWLISGVIKDCTYDEYLEAHGCTTLTTGIKSSAVYPNYVTKLKLQLIWITLQLNIIVTYLRKKAIEKAIKFSLIL